MTSASKILILLSGFFVLSLNSFQLRSQNLTSSPYSRFGLGELNQSGFAQSSAMGGVYVAVKPDSTAPLFINAANPAAIGDIKLATYEVGGMALFSLFTNSVTNVKNRTSNFSYGSIGFPIGQKKRAGGCFGLMPYSNVGYNLLNTETVSGVGDVVFQYFGDGGINKAFVGIGAVPVKKRRGDISIGAKFNYLFGSLNQTSNVLYPGSITYYNTRRIRSTNFGDVTANFGLQSSYNIYKSGSRELKLPVKIIFGYYISVPSLVNVKYNNLIYNYSLSSLGYEVPKDTVLNIVDRKSTVKLPLEQGFGLAVKKGERFNLASDFTYTQWQQFRFLDMENELKNSFRINIGMNYVPGKSNYSYKSFGKRIQYRLGATYSNGFLELKNTAINNYAVTAGIGFPVGQPIKITSGHIITNMVNISAQFGQMGSVNNNLIKENYIRIILGLTFNDEWFIKRRYD